MVDKLRLPFPLLADEDGEPTTTTRAEAVTGPEAEDTRALSVITSVAEGEGRQYFRAEEVAVEGVIRPKWRDVVLEDAPGGGRSAGSLAWAGLGNTYYWIDPSRDVCGVILTQLLPFADKHSLEAFAGFEKGIYAGLDAGSEQRAA